MVTHSQRHHKRRRSDYALRCRFYMLTVHELTDDCLLTLSLRVLASVATL